MRCGAGILKWNANELKSLDRKTIKFMTMYGALHPKNDIAKVYFSRKKGGSGLIGMYKDGRKQFGMVCQEFNCAID